MREIERHITRRIREFDPLSLMVLLEHHGYTGEQLFFRSHPSLCSQDTLFEAIEFKKTPTPHVVISVNMGLLGAQTCLPAYLLKQLEQAPVEAFHFLHFFDHPLLTGFFRSLYPEQDTRIFPDFKQEQRNQLLLMGLRSPSTLHLMLSLIFPELEVRVEKTMLSRNLHTRPFILGSGKLGGTHVLGSFFNSAAQGLRVQLFSDTETAVGSRPWPRVIAERLETRLFPVLGEVGVELEIFLVVRRQRSWARLTQGSFLGYDKFKGGSGQPRRLKIFSGTVLAERKCEVRGA